MKDAQISSMSGSPADETRAPRAQKLPLRDWMLLPTISLLTICAISVTTEWIARRMFPGSKTGIASCLVLNDPSTGVRAIPNSVCWEKAAESKLVEFRFNSCGDRAGMECGPKAPDKYRIVMTGASMAMGWYVDREYTFAGELPTELSRRTGRGVELYNQGLIWKVPHDLAMHADELTAAKPDLILWVLTPLEIKNVAEVIHGPELHVDHGFMGATRQRIQEAFVTKSIPDAFKDVFEVARDLLASRTSAMLLRHYLYQSQSEYVKLFLMGGDDVGFLQDQPSAEWQGRLRQFDRDAAAMTAQAKTAAVPLAVVLIPDRAQAAMISMGEWPAGYDPYKLNEELRSIVTRHGGIYLDILPGFRKIPNPEQYYFPVDGHPDAAGHAIIAELLANELTSGAVPALKTPAQPQAAPEQRR